jgi:hypothetical protein
MKSPNVSADFFATVFTVTCAYQLKEGQLVADFFKRLV